MTFGFFTVKVNEKPVLFHRSRSKEILAYLGRRELFDDIIDQTRIVRKKPEPDAFLAAMEQYGVSPENTIVFEDAEPGVQAAKAAGLQYFRVEEICPL